ncbi:MAG: glycosyltransferase [Neorhizobium sp.]|nr:glycosyltransferase [Neorhizobium sp.]
MESKDIFAGALKELPFLAACRFASRESWNGLTEKHNPHLSTQSSEINYRDPVHCFWSGAPLPEMARLSLQSMIRQGHPVSLYTYDSVAEMQAIVPAGVVVGDAAAIVPAVIYRRALSTSEIRYFSDIFRYAVLHEIGGWWLDTDVVLVKPLLFTAEHVFSSQWTGLEAGHVCVGDVMRAPKGSLHMANLYRMALGRLLDDERTEYGAVGPSLLSEYIFSPGNESLIASVLSPTFFNSIDWQEVELFASEDRTGFELLGDPRVTGVHLWSKMWAEKNLDFSAAPEGSVAGYLKKLILQPNWLTELAAESVSDKGAVYRDRLGHHYTRIYHELFRSRTLERIRILEIGLCRGRVEGWVQDQVPSLQMWLRYFPNAEVVGADIEDFSWFSHPRAKIFQVDQGDRHKLNALARDGGKFDIIIDDASHASIHQHLTLGVLFPQLNKGGFFIIEDLDWQPPEIPSEGAALMKDVLYVLKRDGQLISTVMTPAEARFIADEVGQVYLNESFSELTTRGQIGGLGTLTRKQ